MTTTTDPKYLAKKEKDLFDTLLDLYDEKEFSKGKRATNTILAKYPNHGETHAIKGLFMHAQGDTTEGFDCAKKGLRLDVKSHVCWHVLGMLHQKDCNYKEATKFYSNALRLDPNSLNILRDLSFTQMQLRDLAGYLESRRRMIVIKPALRGHWLGFISANYMMNNFDVAVDLINKYRDAWKGERNDRYEESETLFFQNRCLEKQGLYEKALEHLDLHAPMLVDPMSLMAKKAEFLIRLGRYDEAKPICISLLKQQPDNYRLHTLLQIAFLHIAGSLIDEMMALKHLALPATHFVLSSSQLKILQDLYDNQYVSADGTSYVVPSSNAFTKIKLSLLEGEKLKIALDAYLRQMLHKNVPSVGDDICSLLLLPATSSDKMNYVSDAADFKSHPIVVMVMALLNNYIEHLKRTNQFPPLMSTSESEEGYVLVDEVPVDTVTEEPTTLLWSMFLKCKMLEKSGMMVEALDMCEQCVRHTPTAIDMHAKKAKLLKKSGDVMAAAAVMDQARELDLQDRYSNNKATKYFLRADQMDKAMDTIALFTKHDGSPQQILHDLQCTWYEAEAGECYERTRTWGMALKKYHAVLQNYEDYSKDAFDFHGFALRKKTLRSYTDMLILLDNVRCQNSFQRAARGAIRIYLKLADGEPAVNNMNTIEAGAAEEGGNVESVASSDAPTATTGASTSTSTSTSAVVDEDKLATMTAAERKKYKAKLKKLQKKKEAAAKDEEDESPTGVAIDPHGLAHLHCSDPLAEATKWSDLLFAENQNTSSCVGLDAESIAAAVEVNMRLQRYTVCHEALAFGLSNHPHHPSLVLTLTKLSLQLQVLSARDISAQVASEHLAELYAEYSSIQAYIEYYAEHCLSSVLHRIAAAEALMMCAKSSSAAAESNDHTDMSSDLINAKCKIIELLQFDALSTCAGFTFTNLVKSREVLMKECAVVDKSCVVLFTQSCAEKFPLAKAFGGDGYKVKTLEDMFSIAPTATA